MNKMSKKVIWRIVISIGACIWIIRPIMCDKSPDTPNLYEESLLEIEDYEEYFNDTEIEKKESELPYVGMREEDLNYTSLGKADSIKKCKDFDKLVARARSKTYKWEKTSEHGWYKITVGYRKYFSNRVDDYIDLPASNGFVSSITYYDENGQMKTDYYHDTY